MTVALRSSFDGQPAPARPRVYRYRELVDGCPAWYALRRTGEVVAPGVRIVLPGESEADVVVELLNAVEAADAESHRAELTLIKPSSSTQPG